MKRFFETDHLVKDLKNRSVRGGVASMATQIAKLVLQVGSTMLLARLLTPEDYGIFGMAVVVTGFLALFNDLGLSMATVQRREITHGQVSALFWLNAGLGVVIALLAVLLAPAVAWFFDEPRLTSVIAVLAGSFFVGSLAVQHQALLRRQMRFGRLALLDATSLAAGVGAGLLCAWRGMGYWSLVGMHLTLVTTTTLGAWLLCRWVPGRPGAGARGLVGFGANLMGFNTVNYLGKSVDNLLLGWRWGAISVGFFSNARRLMQLPLTQLIAPTTQVAVPALSRIADQPDRYRAAYQRFVDKVLLFALPGVAFLIAASGPLVAVLLGPQWSESAKIFAILGAGALLEPLTSTTGWLFISQGRVRELFRLGICDACLRFGLVAVALPWGARGVAVAVAARIVVYFPLACFTAGRRGPVRAMDIAQPLLAPAIAACAVLGGVLALRDAYFVGAEPLTELLACLALALAVAFAVSLILPPTRRALFDLRNALVEVVREPEAEAAQPEEIEEPAPVA